MSVSASHLAAPFNPFNLQGRVAMVTGCNTGIGAGIALALAQAGADIDFAAPLLLLWGIC